tara:strand:+ start:36343 stop:40041 length:3699 start_codon:yes stop_codon:yes gene_type:complete
MLININEVDNSSPTVVETFAGIPAAIIGTSQTGPAFVPQLVNSEETFIETFGNISSEHFGSVAVRAWYSEAQANAGLVYLRVLGVGDGKKRTTNSRVANAGFVVGANNVRTEAEKALYSSVTVGSLQNNPYANETAASDGGAEATVVLADPVSPDTHNQTLIVTVGGSVVLTITTDDGTPYTATPTLSGATHTLGIAGTQNATSIFAALAHLLNQLDGFSATANGATDVTVTADAKADLTSDITLTGTYISGGHFSSTSTLGRRARVAPAAPGRMYFLSTIMSQSDGSTYLTDAGLTGYRDPILRAVLLVASGVQLQVSGWRPGDSGEQDLSGSSVAQDFLSGNLGQDAGNWIGASRGNGAVQLILNGLKDVDSRVINFNLDPDTSGYLDGINTEPDRFDELGHYLYAHYPVPSALAIAATASLGPNTAHGSIHSFVQGGETYYHNVLLTTGSAARNTYGESGYKPNYEGWEDRFSTPFTPWVISQPVGGVETKLFRLHALDDGQGTEDQFFAEISNIIYPADSADYATFDLTVRGYGDNVLNTDTTQASPTDNNRFIQSYQGLSLDPNADNYIAREIGDYHRYYNFDVNTNEQKLVLAGMYENQNRYFRVEVTDDVANGKISKSLVPFGFQGMHHLVTSGSNAMLSDIELGHTWNNAYTHTTALEGANAIGILSGNMAGIGMGMIVPPVPLRTKNKNDANSTTVYPWGVRFDRPGKGFLYTDTGDSVAKSLTGNTQGSVADQYVNNSNNLWASGKNLDLVRQLNKFYPSYSTSPMWVGDNAGVANSSEGAVLDSNEFNRNKFTLGRVYVATKTVNSVVQPDDTRWHQAHYIRDGVDPSTAGFRFLKATDLKETFATQNYTSFVLPFQGGFDGLNIFSDNKYKMNHWAAHFEQKNSSTQGGLLGSTVAAYRKGIEIIAEKTDVDINALAIPGQRSTFITDHAANKMEERFDAIYLMDIELCDQYGNGDDQIMFDGNPGESLDVSRVVNTQRTIERFSGRGLSNSFAAAYYPNVSLAFPEQGAFGGPGPVNSYDQMPPSIAALAAFARTDRLEGAWGTPAGYDNGRPSAITNTQTQLVASDTKELSVNSINPIVIYNDQVAPVLLSPTDLGVQGTAIIAGQRTLLNKNSALSRLDVRKLMVYIRRKTRDIAYNYIFEPNQSSVLTKFSQEVESLLETLATAGAVQQFRVVIDETTTSQADIENNTVRGKVFVQPYKSTEIIAIDLNINNTDQA